MVVLHSRPPYKHKKRVDENSPNCLVPFALHQWEISYIHNLNTALSSPSRSVCSDRRSWLFRIYFQRFSFLKDDAILTFFNNAPGSSQPILSRFWILLRCFLCLMHADDLALFKQTNILSTSTGCVFRHGWLGSEKLLIASVGVK